MTEPAVRVFSIDPAELPPLLAVLYAAPEDAVAWMAQVCERAWVALSADDEVLGAAGARPSPAHGAELVGGAWIGSPQHPTALALARAAQAEVGQAYAFAEPSLWPLEALEAAGWREVGAYRRLAGRLPVVPLALPQGVQLLPLTDVPDLGVRLEALSAFEDRIGHHALTPDAAQDGAGGFDPALSRVALDGQGRGIGICRAAQEDGVGRVDSPGIHPEWRHTPVRAALLNAVNAALRAQGVTELNMDSWGDTAEELAHDLRAGLHVVEETPIYATP